MFMLVMLAIIVIIYTVLAILQTINESEITCNSIFFPISGGLNVVISLILIGVGYFVGKQSKAYVEKLKL